MLTIVGQIIIAIVVLLVVWNLYTEEKIAAQINCALVLIPLVLRMLLVK